ncbi:hypothetical protein Tco_0218504 [Tanacetum coccineum]
MAGLTWQSYTSRNALIGGNPKGNDTRAKEKTHQSSGSCTKMCRRSTSTLTHGLPRWQSMCSLNDPRAKIREPMIEKNEDEGLIGASNRLRGLEASLRQYKYKQGLTQKKGRSSL